MLSAFCWDSSVALARTMLLHLKIRSSWWHPTLIPPHLALTWGSYARAKLHASWQTVVALCCMLLLTPKEVCAKDVSWDLSISVLSSACVNQGTGCGQEPSSCEAQPNQWSGGTHTLEADLGETLTWSVCGHTVSPVASWGREANLDPCLLSNHSWCVWGWESQQGDLFGCPTREDEPCTSARVTYFPSFKSSLEQ